MTVPVIIGWSGGKDSALTLDTLRRDPAYSVVGLLTTVTNRYDRVSIHGVRRSLLAEQAGQLGLPVYEARVEPNCSNADYEASFLTALLGVGRKHPGVAHIAFGDLFLADVRAYRERLLQGSGWTPLFPLWEQDTGELARRFIESGYRARLVCVDTTLLEQSFVGREFDDGFLSDLPESVDPCGERGEFHTFVSDGPNFARAVQYQRGEVVVRESRFAYCDLF